MVLGGFSIRQPNEDIGEPFGRIYTIDFAGGHERLDHDDGFGGLVRPGEQVVFATDCDGSDAVFD